MKEPAHRPLGDLVLTGYSILRERIFQLAAIILIGTGIVYLLVAIKTAIPAGEGLFNQAQEVVGGDFVVFYSAAVLVLRGDADFIYDPVQFHHQQLEILGVEVANLPWRYPPLFLLMLSPLGLFSYLAAYWSWAVTAMAALAILARKVVAEWPAFLLLPLCPTVLFSLVAGQNGSLSAIMLGSGMVLLARHPAIAGIAFGLLAYKPQMAVVVPFCLFAGRCYLSLVTMAATAIGLALASLLVFGADVWVRFFHGLLAQMDLMTSSANLGALARMPTAMALASQAFGDYRLSAVAQAIAAVAAICVATWVWRRTSALSPRALAMAAAIPLATPYIWDFDLAILIVPIAFLATDMHRPGYPLPRFAVVALMWYCGPAIREVSGHIGWQPGPMLWVFLLGYTINLVLREPYPNGFSVRSGTGYCSG
jgi:hypothetical protein